MPEAKSEELHALHGTTSVAESGPPAMASKPRCPRELSPEARRVFRALCRLLESRRALTAGDSEILRLYAVLRDRHTRALEHIAKEGEITEYVRLDAHGEQVKTVAENKWLAIAQDCEGRLTSILDRCGLTPVNRPRVKPTRSETEAAIIFN